MRRTLRAIVLVFALFAAVCTASPALAAEDAPKAKIADLAWMTGHWSGPMQNGTLEENWIQPTAKSLAALVRSTSGDATSMIELIVIEEENDTLDAAGPAVEPWIQAAHAGAAGDEAGRRPRPTRWCSERPPKAGSRPSATAARRPTSS